jgi:hypothetical protein
MSVCCRRSCRDGGRHQITPRSLFRSGPKGCVLSLKPPRRRPPSNHPQKSVPLRAQRVCAVVKDTEKAAAIKLPKEVCWGILGRPVCDPGPGASFCPLHDVAAWQRIRPRGRGLEWRAAGEWMPAQSCPERLLDDGAVFEQIALQEIAASRWAETGAGVSML